MNDATAWKWYTGSGCGDTLIGIGTSIVVTPSTNPNYTTYYVRGEGSCVAPGSCSQITIYTTSYSISTNSNQVCPGESVSFGINGNSNDVTSWAWDFGDGHTSNLNPQNNVTTTFPLTSPATYHVTLHITTNNVCSTFDMSTDITVSSTAIPNAEFGYSNNGEACPGDPLQFYPNNWSLSSYSWDFGDGSSSTQTSPYHAFNPPSFPYDYTKLGIYLFE